MGGAMYKLTWVLWGCLCAGAELPVRQVVLYKNGVGYFERTGGYKNVYSPESMS